MTGETQTGILYPGWRSGVTELNEEIVMIMNTSIFVSRLNKLRQLNGKCETFVNSNLYQLLTKEESLVAGYEMVKSNKGSTTPGSQNLSLDAFSLQRIRNLQLGLRNESWAPSPARRVSIPQPGKIEKRPLGIQGPEEKVVQSVLTRILESIYEPIFSRYSFGFRPSRGAHDALKMIANNYDGVCFAIEGDIKGMYDNVNHHILIGILKRKIQDDRLIRLIWKLLRSGYMEDGKVVNTVLGIPQGSIVSPILANIYLHELDVFMCDLCKEAVTRSPNIRTPVYKKLEAEKRFVHRVLARNNLSPEDRAIHVRQLKLLQNKGLSTRMYRDPSDRILYTRYADDFIVGIAGSEELALTIKERMRSFLESLSLTLSLEKTKVTNLRKENAKFLGHYVGINTVRRVRRTRVKGRSPFTRRVTGKLVVITAPVNDIVKRLHNKGFCDRKGFPRYKLSWITQEDNQIISLFNSTSRGLFQFYSEVSRKHALSRIRYILKFSCAMTLAAKHSCSLAQIFQKHGSNLRVCFGEKGEKENSLFHPDLKLRYKKWISGRQLPDPLRYIATRG